MLNKHWVFILSPSHPIEDHKAWPWPCDSPGPLHDSTQSWLETEKLWVGAENHIRDSGPRREGMHDASAEATCPAGCSTGICPGHSDTIPGSRSNVRAPQQKL